MARNHARVYLSIWEDDDFRALSPAAQHLYFVLMTSPEMGYAGVTDWRPKRIAKRAGSWTAEAVGIAADELAERLYIVIDDGSEEVLLRSLIRHDGLLDSPNLAVAVRKAWSSVASPDLRAVIVHELVRLRTDKPDLKGWANVADLLDKPSRDPSVNPSRNPSEESSGVDSRRGSGTGSEKGSPITAPSSISLFPTPAPMPDGSTQGEDRYVSGRASNATDPPPRCAKHPNGNPTDEPCAGCARLREWDERRAAEARQQAVRARQQCPDCGGSGWAEDDHGNPTRKCDHPRTARVS